jgi:hypothetical protein
MQECPAGGSRKTLLDSQAARLRKFGPLITLYSLLRAPDSPQTQQ